MLGRNIAAFVIIGIILVAIFALFFYNNKNYENSKLKVFISVLTGLGIFLTFFFYYNVVELQYQQQIAITNDNIEKLNEKITNSYLKGLESSSNIVPKFVASILPLIYTQEEVDDIEEEDTYEARIQKYILSRKIFALWVDYMAYYDYILKGNKDTKSYVVIFLQRARSEQLKAIWEISKYEYDYKVVCFGDLLFEYSSKAQTQTITEYITLSEKMIEDARYKKLIN